LIRDYLTRVPGPATPPAEPDRTLVDAVPENTVGKPSGPELGGKRSRRPRGETVPAETPSCWRASAWPTRGRRAGWTETRGVAQPAGLPEPGGRRIGKWDPVRLPDRPKAEEAGRRSIPRAGPVPSTPPGQEGLLDQVIAQRAGEARKSTPLDRGARGGQLVVLQTLAEKSTSSSPGPPLFATGSRPAALNWKSADGRRSRKPPADFRRPAGDYLQVARTVARSGSSSTTRPQNVLRLKARESEPGPRRGQHSGRPTATWTWTTERKKAHPHTPGCVPKNTASFQARPCTSITRTRSTLAALRAIQAALP